MRVLTRNDGLDRLREFLAHAGRYAAERNHDHGPGNHRSVSMLSPYLRHRLITEEEVARAVLERFSYSSVEKFLQEVAWRTYWKGWLEMRPGMWDRYREEVGGLQPSADALRAMEGRTGIDCFDAWVGELLATGYLHNHARMWFASIWIFTLRLPWQLGADFFLRHLLDGDPAANTLSWRWVAGLHTKGKHYLARAENIAKYTAGRFDPAGVLNETALPLTEEGEVAMTRLRLPESGLPQGRVGHLMLADDLGPPLGTVVAAAGWHPAKADALWPVVSPVVHAARSSAVDDAVVLAGGTRLDGSLAEGLARWVTEERLDAVWVAYPTVGPWRAVLDGLDVPVHRFLRAWDRSLWPHATAGYFQLKKRLPGFFKNLRSVAE